MEQQSVDWTEANASITVEQLDNLVAEYLKAREVYEAAKKVSGQHYAEYQVLENKLVATLTEAGKKSYKVDGVGTATRVQKSVVTVPKDVTAKRELFGWITDTYGKDVLDTLVSINHQSLNSFYNQEVERHKDNPLFLMPGLDAPTTVESLSFRRG